MGYNIHIGNAVLTSDDQNEYYVVIPVVELSNAPIFDGDGSPRQSNVRWPSYGGWADFVDSAHLRGLFFDEENGLMRDHPGVFKLTTDHLRQVKEAMANWQTTHPGAVAGFEDGQDRILARLRWLEFWLQWAIDNCEMPAIKNS